TYMWTEAREGFFLFRQKFLKNHPQGWILERHLIPRKAVGFFDKYEGILKKQWKIHEDIVTQKKTSPPEKKEESIPDMPETNTARVLVVDGDGSTAAAFMELFGNDHEIVTADDANEAFACLKKTCFDLVITEVKLPGKISGLRLQEKIREHYPDTPIVVVTSSPNVDTAIKALRNGAINFLCKPLDTLQLQQMLSRVLEMKRGLRNYVLTQEYVVSEHRLEVPSSLEHVKGVVNYFILRTILADCYPHWIIAQIQLALQEVLINAMIHGNRLDTNKKVKIKARIDSEKFEVEITDEGEGFDPSTLLDPSSEDNLDDLLEYGRGVFLVRCSMDEVSFNEKGNSVRMVKYRVPILDKDRLPVMQEV
ncbi:MAG: ATP-binding protein, partial [Candidatus Eremiobacteraeota bacterium]|nr:ATP-binding protein [Candidatus Eremiobacteraeota bacterium]